MPRGIENRPKRSSRRIRAERDLVRSCHQVLEAIERIRGGMAPWAPNATALLDQVAERLEDSVFRFERTRPPAALRDLEDLAGDDAPPAVGTNGREANHRRARVAIRRLAGAALDPTEDPTPCALCGHPRLEHVHEPRGTPGMRFVDGLCSVSGCDCDRWEDPDPEVRNA